ncbi:hypothetical protein A3D78_04055 [Candidatus Gottesmanbacteria bacterium RIFCSPHIGHO2_02_FULL_39_14]|uniref:Uncharacterized protein n=1 Tax=Candidatus Gottesmanbacteria bacterium RIFCSPHIGHO2_02_FULL_39_14 TaxID=1798383 RepID=A0A1F5ZY09_9BACT|nr:MAG: hypothetical protein A3D78_04055 [Candidatus Gottesmanbacteria bacterium RIFCSPHIGHO2_02_FULL_39_14]
MTENDKPKLDTAQRAKRILQSKRRQKERTELPWNLIIQMFLHLLIWMIAATSWVLTESTLPFILAAIASLVLLFRRKLAKGLTRVRTVSLPRPRAPRLPFRISKIDWVLWPIALTVWALTAENAVLVWAVILRVGWWILKNGGKITLQKAWEERVPDAVRESIASSSNTGCVIFLVKILGMLIVAIAALFIHPILSIAVVIMGILWLRKPTPPKIEEDGTLVFPTPFLFALIHPMAFFQPQNEIGPEGVRVGFFRFGLDRRKNFPPEAISTIDVTDSLPGWLFGGIWIEIQYKPLETAKKVEPQVFITTRWDSPEKIEKQLRGVYKKPKAKETIEMHVHLDQQGNVSAEGEKKGG